MSTRYLSTLWNPLFWGFIWRILGVLASRRLIDQVISCLGRSVSFVTIVSYKFFERRFDLQTTRQNLWQIFSLMILAILEVNGTRIHSIAFCADSDIPALDGFGWLKRQVAVLNTTRSLGAKSEVVQNSDLRACISVFESEMLCRDLDDINDLNARFEVIVQQEE